jgi:hypothetical protein
MTDKKAAPTESAGSRGSADTGDPMSTATSVSADELDPHHPHTSHCSCYYDLLIHRHTIAGLLDKIGRLERQLAVHDSVRPAIFPSFDPT